MQKKPHNLFTICHPLLTEMFFIYNSLGSVQWNYVDHPTKHPVETFVLAYWSCAQHLLLVDNFEMMYIHKLSWSNSLFDGSNNIWLHPTLLWSGRTTWPWLYGPTNPCTWYGPSHCTCGPRDRMLSVHGVLWHQTENQWPML
jgi:hypothetical protein